MNKVICSIMSGFCLYLGLSVTHVAQSIDVQVIPYYKKFMYIANQCKVKPNVASLRIEMTEKLEKSNWVAVCYYQDNLIRINRLTWQRLTKSQREQTIHHELGHCLLNQGHNDTDINLMNSAGFLTTEQFKKYYDYYVRRLFKGCAKPKYEHFIYEEVEGV